VKRRAGAQYGCVPGHVQLKRAERDHPDPNVLGLGTLGPVTAALCPDARVLTLSFANSRT
jgi:hypothetical protein